MSVTATLVGVGENNFGQKLSLDDVDLIFFNKQNYQPPQDGFDQLAITPKFTTDPIVTPIGSFPGETVNPAVFVDLPKTEYDIIANIEGNFPAPLTQAQVQNETGNPYRNWVNDAADSEITGFSILVGGPDGYKLEVQFNGDGPTFEELIETYDEVLFSNLDGTLNGAALEPQSGGNTGETGLNEILGKKGKDKLKGSNDDDLIDGKGGNDKIYGKGGDDEIIGGDGNDKLFGDGGHDLLVGGKGNDKLNGGAGNDELIGGAGKDKFTDSKGDDIMNGGEGKDTFIFKGKKSGGHDTVIASYEDGDKIKIKKFGIDVPKNPTDAQVEEALAAQGYTLEMSRDEIVIGLGPDQSITVELTPGEDFGWDMFSF